MKREPNNTATLSQKVAAIPKSKLFPGGPGPYRVTKFIDTTTKFDFPGGHENVPIDRLVRVLGVPESLPRLQGGSPSPFGDKDEIIGHQTSRTDTPYRIRYNGNRPSAWVSMEDIPADVVFTYHDKTGVSFPKSRFMR